MSASTYDAVIAGGGLVGGSLAIALAEAGCSVALVEAVPPDSAAQPSFDDRMIALSRGSCRILEQLGVWPALADDVWPIEQIHVSQQGNFGTALLDAAQQGVPYLGYVIKSRAIGQALWARIRELAAIDTFCPATVTASEVTEQHRVVQLDTAAGAETLSARLLVVADGARSSLRPTLGISAAERDYQQVAVVANVQVDERRDGHVAYERFTSEGPLAVLPGPAGQYTFVLARNADSVAEVMAMDDAGMLALLQQLLGFRLGRLRRIGARQAYPLYLVTAERLTAERAVVVGNAANGLHPVAAQGFNLGLRDVACLAEVLADERAATSHVDPGGPELLARYADWRRPDQTRVVRFTDGLIRFFGQPGKTAAVARGLSLAAFDLVPPAKQELARQTMGLAGRMSRLARGLRL